jgi:hypothetical protein
MPLNPLRLVAVLAACGALAAPAAAQRHGRILWSGNVDDTAVVTVYGRTVQAQSLSHTPLSSTAVQVYGRLPRRPVFVSVRRQAGRGSVSVIQQPRRANGFTAQVRVHDPQPGSSRYRFALVW